MLSKVRKSSKDDSIFFNERWLEVINFINQYGVTIAQTYQNSDVLHEVLLGHGEKSFEDKKYEEWSCHYADDFIYSIYKYDRYVDLSLSSDDQEIRSLNKQNIDHQKLNFNSFEQNFTPNRGFLFEIADHVFHVLYFNDDHIYLVDYYFEFHRPYFSFHLTTKPDVLEYVKGELSHDCNSRKKFLLLPPGLEPTISFENETMGFRRIQIHELDYIPSICDIYTTVYNSRSGQSVDFLNDKKTRAEYYKHFNFIKSKCNKK